MLTARPTEPRWVVFSRDGALDGVPYQTLNEYMIHRDITKLPIDLRAKINTENGQPVTLFKIKPPSRKAAIAMDANEYFSDDVLRSHIVEVHNYPGVEIGPDPETGDQCLTKASIDKMDDSVLHELRLFLRDFGRGASGDDRPFSLPDGWSGDLMRSYHLRAVSARIEAAASDAASVSASEDGQVPSE